MHSRGWTLDLEGSVSLGPSPSPLRHTLGEKPVIYPDPCKKTFEIEGAVHGSYGISWGVYKLKKKKKHTHTHKMVLPNLIKPNSSCGLEEWFGNLL